MKVGARKSLRESGAAKGSVARSSDEVLEGEEGREELGGEEGIWEG